MDLSVHDLWSLASVFFLVALNGFFVASEFALVSVRRSRIEAMVDQKVHGARAVQSAIGDLDRYIAGTQVGITIASLALGWIGEPALVHILAPVVAFIPGLAVESTNHGVSAAVAFAMITFMHVVLGELVPKSLALQKPESVSMWVARPMLVVVFLFRPAIWALNGTGNALLRTIGIQPAGQHHNVHGVEELEILVRQSHDAGVLDDLEQQILQGTFRFSELTASEVMVPRIDMVTLDLSKSTPEILEAVSTATHNRLPVHEGNPDHIIGVLHVHDLFRAYQQQGGNLVVRNLVRPALIVPEFIHLDQLLKQFRERYTQMAILVDEFGGTVGVITLEDIVEELFGEMLDEHEADRPKIQTNDDGVVLVRGEVRLDELREAVGWELVDEEMDTVGGFVMSKLGRIARLHDVVETPQGQIRVTNMARMRITQVALIPRPPASAEPAP